MLAGNFEDMVKNGILTDEDIAGLSGKAEELASVLRLRYRYGRVEADVEIRNWLHANKKVRARA